ncbi:hypothetical protein AC578_3056 [Pseudocercospora eumusae]|uniref:Uncharacterized protein n=1 Tax=Pseudocercospora eumusae TaxID=321146 RepID=A0A139H9X9_9PEZI|nr:hypothetical protein AC578_3056 [Pseudocercospora eumusae]
MMQFNKQIRTEFRDIYDSKSIMKVIFSRDGNEKLLGDWQVITDRVQLKRVLEYNKQRRIEAQKRKQSRYLV